jgi:aspartate/methionine/tyrosine aminotransferase
MKVEQFAMERMQSTFENLVDYNLSESGVRPVTPRELLEETGALEGLLDQPLVYTQSNGTIELRSAIAALYDGATPDHIEVTNGGSEANYLALWRLVEPGDDVVMLVPTYMQSWGLARAFGGAVREWPLIEDRAAGRWRVDLDRLEAIASKRTRLIVICNPNNPTWARLQAGELDLIGALADRHGAWVLSDEIYRGAEIDGRETATMWGRARKVLVTSGLSKAYGLPGLRIGWIAGPPDTIASLWSYHDYTTIAPGALSDRLARAALEPARRTRLLERTRGILRANLPVVEQWLASAGGDRPDSPAAFTWIRPEAGAIVYVNYGARVNSTHLVTELRERRSVLIVPGDHFGMDGYLRIGFGEPSPYLLEGLNRLRETLAALTTESAATA